MAEPVQPLTTPVASGAAEPGWSWLPQGTDRWVLSAVALGWLALFGPTFWDWAQGRWAGETQGHEVLILGISAWLLFRKRDTLAALTSSPSAWGGNMLLALGLFCYLFGRTQEVLRIELFSLIVVTAALLLRFRGPRALRVAWFPLFFMLFALPLPYSLVLTLTGPMKLAVSIVATALLDLLGYPVGRSGVIVTIGQYQLLVTEACAGLQTMFTLEAMGLLYASLMDHDSTRRNLLLATMVVPVAFCANVVRVSVLALVTFYLGDAAGQGFLHGLAGMMLFMVALALIMAVDGVLGAWLEPKRAAA